MSTADQPSGMPGDEPAAPASAEEPAQTPAAEETPLPSLPGAVLLAERRAQGLSQGDVARQLKLSVRQVEALEQDEYANFPGPVFVRGFLRNYAKLLRLDAETIVRLASLPSIADAAAAEVQAPAEQAVRSSRVPLIAGVLVLLVLLGVMIALRGGKERGPDRNAPASAPGLPGTAVSPQHADSPPPSSPQAAGAPAAADHTAAGAAAMQAGQPEPAAVAASAVTPVTPIAPTASTASAATATAPVPSPAPEASSTSPAERSEIRLAFEKESWVEIRDGAGSIIYSRMNQPGSQRTVLGVPPLSVVIGNAHGVKLSYRGKAVDLGPHTRVAVARLVLE